MNMGPYWNLDISSSITNNESRRVGLRIQGKLSSAPDVSIWPTSRNRAKVFLNGTVSNTFTGDVEVLDSHLLFLNKSNGATAVRGNIAVRKGAGLVLWQSNQIADSATVTLDGRQYLSGFSFEAKNYTMTEKFHRLIVQGEGLLYFYNRPTSRTLFLDDLQVEYGGVLRIADWINGVTRLLVRKDSAHLSESLNRISFDHNRARKAGLREYDKDYWEIGPGFPEPASYGAILVGVVGLVVRRRQKK